MAFTLDQINVMLDDRRTRLEAIAGLMDITENGVTINVESRRKSLMDEIDWLNRQRQLLGAGEPATFYGRAT